MSAFRLEGEFGTDCGVKPKAFRFEETGDTGRPTNDILCGGKMGKLLHKRGAASTSSSSSPSATFRSGE